MAPRLILGDLQILYHESATTRSFVARPAIRPTRAFRSGGNPLPNTPLRPRDLVAIRRRRGSCATTNGAASNLTLKSFDAKPNELPTYTKCEVRV